MEAAVVAAAVAALLLGPEQSWWLGSRVSAVRWEPPAAAPGMDCPFGSERRWQALYDANKTIETLNLGILKLSEKLKLTKSTLLTTCMDVTHQ